MPSKDTATAGMNPTSTRGGSLSSASNEVRALSSLAFDELSRFPGAIRDMHLGIAQRAFRGVGPAGRPVQLIHDAVSGRAYGAIGAGASGLGKAVDATMQRRGIGGQASLSTTPMGSFGIAVLNGLIGDRLEREGSALHQPTSARMHGQPIGLDESSLREAFPHATPRLAVFIHGLTGDEFCWSWGQNPATNPRARRPTARGWPLTSATRRSICATTAACTSPRTAARSRRCYRSSCSRGRSRWSRLRWSATPWVAWWRAAPPIRRMRTTKDGFGTSGTSSHWGPRTWAHPSSGAHTGPR